MKFDVLGRFALMSILPATGNFLTLKVVRELRESLSFSEEEFKALGIKQLADNNVSWDKTEEGPEGKEIEIGEMATALIVGILEKLEKEEALTEQQCPLYEKFIVAPADLRVVSR